MSEMETTYVIIGILFVGSIGGFIVVFTGLVILDYWRRFRDNKLADNIIARLSETDRWCAEYPVVVESLKFVRRYVESLTGEGDERDRYGHQSISAFRDRIAKMHPKKPNGGMGASVSEEFHSREMRAKEFPVQPMGEGDLCP